MSARLFLKRASGRIFITDNPKGAAAAFWCRAADASRVAEAAWQVGDIMAAGQRCGVALTPHAVVLRRTAERVSKIDEVIAAGIDAGVLKKFNGTYRARRLQARQRGESFMSYSEALRRLRVLLAKSVARGGEIPKSFSAVFDERPGPSRSDGG